MFLLGKYQPQLCKLPNIVLQSIVQKKTVVNLSNTQVFLSETSVFIVLECTIELHKLKALTVNHL